MGKPARLAELFACRHFDREVIVLCIRGYLRFKLSYRDLVEMMAERGLSIVHTTIMRWVQRYVPEFERRWNRYSRAVGSSWRAHESPHFHIAPNISTNDSTRSSSCSGFRAVATSFHGFTRACRNPGVLDLAVEPNRARGHGNRQACCSVSPEARVMGASTMEAPGRGPPRHIPPSTVDSGVS